ncbi:cupin domain-containing protein [Sphingomonas sp. PAMC 26621]|uniref:cupin domain-containing protein n=1 Tax=Sphingomonas sp. PAMC 26621 TaxID=1112213 RepID=UPI001EE64B96|nr:cupin domain-containing protein [Sphingomonas sp. PAMC 26621]
MDQAQQSADERSLLDIRNLLDLAPRHMVKTLYLTGKDGLPHWSGATSRYPRRRAGAAVGEGGRGVSTVDQDVIAIGALQIRYLIDGTRTGAAAGMFELTIPPGAQSPPAHSHDNEEYLYCLEGAMRCFVGDEVRALATGDTNYTPPGVIHAFDNPHGTSARVLVINSPDIGAQYFRDISAVLASGPDPARMGAVMRRYGLRLVPPKAAGVG